MRVQLNFRSLFWKIACFTIDVRLTVKKWFEIDDETLQKMASFSRNVRLTVKSGLRLMMTRCDVTLTVKKWFEVEDKTLLCQA